MGTVTRRLIGRFGNQTMQYLHARAYAEKYGHTFQCESWLGDEVFDLRDQRITDPSLPVRTEDELHGGEGDVELSGYAQCQAAMIYTKKQAQGWLKLGELAQHLLSRVVPKNDELVAHQRRLDYLPLGYPVVSAASYLRACEKFNLRAYPLVFVSDANPTSGLSASHKHLDFLPDWLRLMRAPILLRANSSFSWVAGLLGNGRVFSPVVDGLGAGEHDVEFVEGNHPRFCSLSFVTDLILAT